MTKRIATAFFVLGLSACGTSKSALLINQSSKDLACDPTALRHRRVNGFIEYVDKVEGCGKANIYAYQSGEQNWGSAMDRASFDFSCPKRELQTTVLGEMSVGVSGCDKHAVYIFNPYGRAWMMNTASSKQ